MLFFRAFFFFNTAFRIKSQKLWCSPSYRSREEWVSNSPACLFLVCFTKKRNWLYRSFIFQQPPFYLFLFILLLSSNYKSQRTAHTNYWEVLSFNASSPWVQIVTNEPFINTSDSCWLSRLHPSHQETFSLHYFPFFLQPRFVSLTVEVWLSIVTGLFSK